MSISLEKKLPVAILAVLASLALVAVLSPAAKATEVLPTNDQITAVNTTPTDFIPDNANSAIGLRCQNSTAAFTVDAGRNINRTNTGMYSSGPGSVISDMDANSVGDRAAEFGNCQVWDFSSPGGPVAPATTTTNENNGAWTVAANAVNNDDDVVAIGVPLTGAVVNIPALGCQVEVSNDQASSVFADFTDGTPSSAAVLAVDGQIDFGGNCPLVTPSQFEGSYDVTSASGAPVVIQP